MLDRCENAADGMFVLARAVLHYFHTGMDKFEINLRKLEEDMEKRNARTLMDSILNARFELLYWSNMFIPFSELVVWSAHRHPAFLSSKKQPASCMLAVQCLKVYSCCKQNSLSLGSRV